MTNPFPQNGPANMISETDLAQIVLAFNDATGKLQSAHEALRAEVARLKAELREANAQVERSGRLAALGEMAAGIAHEVRNPLGSIGLYAKMLEEDLKDRPADQELAGKIRRSVRGLDAVVMDVLAFSKEMRVSPERVAAGELLDRAIEEGLAGRSGIEVVREHGAGLGVDCDPTLAHRALVNVVRNAAEAMLEESASGTLRVGVQRRLVPAAGMQGGGGLAMVVIAVRDSGPGVPPDVMQKMFNPFFTTRAAGTGLGLAIVHRIMDAHGGRVSVRNAPGGRGAVVELMFPAEVSAAAGESGQDAKGVATVAVAATGRPLIEQEAA